MIDVVGFGLANIDFVARVQDNFLIRHGIPKGGDLSATPLEFGRMRAELPQYEATPGGCVGNTLCGLSTMGIDTRFYGKIGHDEYESLYRTAFRDYRVAYDVSAADHESSQCAVLITPDGQRSFMQVEGTSFLLNEADIDWASLAYARLLYVEIYACHFGHDTTLFERICETAKQYSIPLYIKIVDIEYGERYRDLLYRYAQSGAITLILGNHDNMPSLTGGTAPTHVHETLKEWPCAMLMTHAAQGGSYFENGRVIDYTATPIEKPVNSSGAGDQFMAGFIAARLDDRPIEECLALGDRTARAILMHNQPRPPLSTRQNIRF